MTKATKTRVISEEQLLGLLGQFQAQIVEIRERRKDFERGDISYSLLCGEITGIAWCRDELEKLLDA